MERTETAIPWRVVACRETERDGSAWAFYLINDSRSPIDSAVLYEVGYEFGDLGNSEGVHTRIEELSPGSSAFLWRDDGSGAELRMDLRLIIRCGGAEVRVMFEFPKLYKKRALAVVEGLGKPGWVAQATVLEKAT